MLWNTSSIEGFGLAATDGEIGTISDLLFDDESWMVRWLVVETGPWLFGRKVLLPTFNLRELDAVARVCSVRLTKKQIEDSPDIDTEKSVSRQMEANVFDYYGWSPYWGSGYYTGGYSNLGAIAAPPTVDPAWREADRQAMQQSPGDPHLRSVDAVNGYHIHARDGEIGHVSDFLVEDADWSIHYLVVDTKNWWPGKKVLISPRWAHKIDWASNQVDVAMSRKRIKESPAYDPAVTVDRDYEQHFHSYYGDDLGTD